MVFDNWEILSQRSIVLTVDTILPELVGVSPTTRKGNSNSWLLEMLIRGSGVVPCDRMSYIVVCMLSLAMKSF